MTFLTSLPVEVFFQATLGSQDIGNPSEAIQTLSTMRCVCKGLREVVDTCWRTVILNSNLIAYLDPFARDDSKPLQFLRENYLKLKKWGQIDAQKWKNNTPTILQSAYSLGPDQHIVQNSTGHPELWTITSSQLTCTDLITSRTTTISKQYCTGPGMIFASADKWVALYYCEIDRLIIYEKGGEKVCHILTNIGKAMEMHIDGKYLFVMTISERKCLRYDSTNWAEEPKVLKLPGLLHLWIGPHEFLFSTNRKPLSVAANYFIINKEEAFSENHSFSSLVNFTQEEEPWMLKAGKEGLFAILDCPDDTTRLSRICLEDGEAIIKTIQLLPLKYNTIHDFYVMHDKVFVTDFIDRELRLSCYDLTQGELLKMFPEENSPVVIHGGNCGIPALSLCASTPERITQIYKARKRPDESGSKEFLAVTTLDYS